MALRLLTRHINNKELKELLCLIISRAGHVARIWEKRNACRILVGKPEERDNWEVQGVGWWTILKWILERQDGMGWIGLIWIGTSGGLL
jgi:hypothetical protein